MGAQLVGNSLADEPQGILCQPAVRCLVLVQLQLFLQKIAKAIDELALQSMPGCSHCAARIAAQLLGHRCAISLYDQFAQHAGVLVLACQHVE